ncbi:hypothetical protein N3K66_007712 [Trichothecium roseum]|uniref:Uncharacterized protein n=1 Tax=Trichothecium roseum TaxID=47278 RepID=A0ACC0UW09_9HYPO|nr:hypothetical protein N3K66_007712 [Trichothecium roseum]
MADCLVRRDDERLPETYGRTGAYCHGNVAVCLSLAFPPIRSLPSFRKLFISTPPDPDNPSLNIAGMDVVDHQKTTHDHTQAPRSLTIPVLGERGEEKEKTKTEKIQRGEVEPTQKKEKRSKEEGKRNMPEYTGPGAGEMIAGGTLVAEIMARDAGPEHERVLDDGEVALLEGFCALPDPADGGARAGLLAEKGLGEVRLGRPGPGAEAETGGSLVAYLIATYGLGDSPLGEDDVRRLRVWFEERGGRQ